MPGNWFVLTHPKSPEMGTPEGGSARFSEPKGSSIRPVNSCTVPVQGASDACTDVPLIWLKYIPYPPRTTVRPSPFMSHATPTRGAKLFISPSTVFSGTPG